MFIKVKWEVVKTSVMTSSGFVPRSQRFFAKRRRIHLATVILNLTSMQLTAVKYVTWVMTLLTNHRGVLTIPPIRNEGQILLVRHDQSTDDRYQRFSSKKQKIKISGAQGNAGFYSYFVDSFPRSQHFFYHASTGTLMRKSRQRISKIQKRPFSEVCQWQQKWEHLVKAPDSILRDPRVLQL